MRLVEGPYKDNIAYCTGRCEGEVFVFDFKYTPANERFRELDRFLWESTHSTSRRFCNRYSGSVVIDVTAWNREYPNALFDAFLYYLKDHEDDLDCWLVSEVEFSEKVVEHIGRLFETEAAARSGQPRSVSRRATIGFADETDPRAAGIVAREGHGPEGNT